MLYLLDKDTKTVKWNGIPLHEASSAIVKEETNGDFYLTVHYPITNSGVYQLIKEDMLIKAPVPVLGAQLFRIKKPVENDDSLDITAYHISDDVMQRSIRPVSVVGQSCTMALSQMVQNAKTGLGDFSFTSDIMDNRTFNTTETETLYSVLLDGKHSIVGTWEGELVRDNFALTIKRNRGADRGVVITTHKNLKSYQRTKNSQSVVTRIHAKSTFKAEGAEEETTITVTVDSPLIGNYPYINEKEYENNDAKTIDELKKWAAAKFANEGIDKVSDAIEIEAYELDGQVIHLGDTVNIKSRKHDVDLYKKAVAYEYNALTEEYISITFDDKPGVGGSGVSSGVANAADVILSANRNAQEVAIERAVKNANQAFDAEFDKRVEVINDGIEQAKAEAELYADTIKQSIDAEIDAVNTSMQAQSEEHDRQVADILSKTQSVEALASQAKTDAASAITEAIRLDTIERQATEAKVANAKSQAIAEANELVETAKGLLSGQISNVSTDLSQTKEAIKLLATRATVDALTGRISSAEASLQVQAGEIASRVKTSDFDQAKQRISTAESSITQLGNRITTEIGTVEGKIPTSVGGQNLVKNGGFPTNTQYWSGSMIVSQHNVYYNGQKKLFSLQTEGTAEILASSNRFAVKRNTNYTLSFYAFASGNVKNSDVYFLGRKSNETDNFTFVNPLIYERRFSGSIAEYVTVTFNSGDNDSGYIRFDNNGSTDGINAVLFFGEVMLVEGAIARTYEPSPEEFATVTALHNVTDTVDSHTRTIGAIGTTGSILDNVSKVTQTANGLVTEVSGANGLKTQVSTLAGSYAIQNLTNSGTVLNQLNLNKDGSVRIDGKLVQITGTTYIEDGVISSAKIGSLDAGKITTGTLNAARIATNSITGSHIVFDQAFVNEMTANEALFKQLFAQNAFITQVQAVTLSASKISGGTLTATNGAMEVNLNAGQILYYTDQAALKRVLSGYPTQFIKFGIGTQSTDNAFRLIGAGSSSTIGASIASFGTNRNNGENNLDGGFTGVNIYSGGTTGTNVVDRIELASDILQIAHAASTEIANDPRGWTFENQNGVNNNYVFRPNTSPNSAYKALIGTSVTPVNELYIDEAYIKGQRLGWILKDIANRIGHSGWANNIA